VRTEERLEKELRDESNRCSSELRRLQSSSRTATYAYRDQLAGLVLQRHAGPVFAGLTSRTFDPYATGFVTMDNLLKFGELVAEMVGATRHTAGDLAADRQVVQAALELLRQNRLAPTLLTGVPKPDAVATSLATRGSDPSWVS
jgi:hypothetical protein